jgi:hypothetical protein
VSVQSAWKTVVFDIVFGSLLLPAFTSKSCTTVSITKSILKQKKKIHKKTCKTLRIAGKNQGQEETANRYKG